MINQRFLNSPTTKEIIRPAKVMNNSAKKQPNVKVRLDKLFRSSQPRILIKRRLGGMGDVIMSTPLIKALKNLIPHCYITYATDLVYADGALGDIILHCPSVDELASYGDVDDSMYDYVVDITYSGLSSEKSGHVPPNRIDLFAEEAGVSVDLDPVPDYVLSAEEINIGSELIKTHTKNTTRQIIIVQPKSNDVRRTWPAEHVNSLCSMLSEKYFVIILDWRAKEKWFSNDYCITLENLAFNEAASVIYNSDLVVCPDSSILHLAGALRKSIVSIFGPIPAHSRINHYENCVAVQLSLPCSGCFYTPKCKDSNRLDCLKLISPEMVFNVIEKKLSGSMDIKSNIIYGKDISKAKQDNIILVKRTTPGLGDLLMAANGIEALKRKYPGKEVHVAVLPECFPALENNPSINKILDVKQPINYKRYFATIDISSPCAAYEVSKISSKKPVDKNRTEIYGIALGVRNLMTDLLPRYYVSEEEKLAAKEELSKLIDPTKKTIAITATSAEIYRDWPKEHLSELCRLLQCYNVLNLNRGIQFPDAINLEMKSFRHVSSLVAASDLLITVDTGPLHVAAALGTPTIALFGPIDYKARCKGYNNITVMKADLPCIPCWRNSKMRCKQTDVVEGYSKCLSTIKALDVFKLVEKKLGTN
jgi:ADP-heptose:LPS heptosyltransferase